MPRRDRSRPRSSGSPAERTHHGDTVIDEYAWLADKENPETIAYLEAENAYTEAMTGGLGGLRSDDLRRDQGAHPGDRPVGADPQGRLVVLLAHRGGPAVRDALPPRGPAGRDHPADARGRGAAGRRGDPARRQRARGRPDVLLARRAVGVSPDGRLAGLLHRLHRRRAVHAADQGPGHRRDARRRGAGHVLRLRLVAGRVGAVLRHRRRRVAAVPGAGGTSSAPRRPTT